MHGLLRFPRFYARHDYLTNYSFSSLWPLFCVLRAFALSAVCLYGLCYLSLYGVLWRCVALRCVAFGLDHRKESEAIVYKYTCMLTLAPTELYPKTIRFS